MKAKFASSTVLAVMVLTGSLRAASTIVYDDFNRTGLLNGSVAVTGQAWNVAVGVSSYITTPSVLTLGSGVAVATISGLTFLNNSTYTLSARMEVLSAANPVDWVAIGFSSATWGGVTTGGSLLLRENDSTTSFNNSVLGQQDIFGAGSSANLLIQLDTGNTLSNSTISFFRNGIQVGISQLVDASQYSTVRIANNNNSFSATVREFTLTQVPEPASPILIGLGCLVMLRRRVRTGS